MRLALLFVPVLVTACATQQEACIANVTRDARVLDALITETRANLSRGYAIAEEQDVVVIRRSCTGTNEDGTTFTFGCDDTQRVSREVPVAIDLNAEREKLVSLEQRQLQNQSNIGAGIAQCRAQFPEEAS